MLLRRSLALASLIGALSHAAGPSPAVEDLAAGARPWSITVTEGTWMNVDVHPDGTRVAFDLMGQIYVVSLAGGDAVALTSGHAWNMHPRFSPDGARIAFTSDRGGGDNLWVMDADGSDAHAVTDASFRLVAQPDWTPDGRWVYGRKHFTGRRSLGTGEIWAFDPSGGGEGVAWTARGHLEADVNEPHVDPTGAWLYVSEAGPFDYNRDVYEGIYQIVRYPLSPMAGAGEPEVVAGGFGGATRPAVSPDGRWLGYLRRTADGQRAAWVVRELATGRERVVYDQLDRDQQETWSLHGTYPTWDWLPDSGGAVFFRDGGLWRVDLAGAATPIPFRATVARSLEPAVRQPHAIAPTAWDAQVVRGPQVSPDGRWVAFQAVGQVWVQPTAGGAAKPVTGLEHGHAYAPTWAPDGGRLAWTTWSDTEGGKVWVAPVDASGQVGAGAVVSTGLAWANHPAFDATGARLVWSRGGEAMVRGGSSLGDDRVRLEVREADGRVHAAGSVAHLSGGTREPRPRFAPDGRHLWVTDQEGESIALVQLTLDGLDRRVLATGEYAAEIVPSPDGRWLAYKALHHAYVTAWPPRGGAPLDLGTADGGTDVTRLSADLGEWLHWSGPTRLSYAAGPTLWRVDLSAGLPDEPVATEPKASRRQPWPAGARPSVGQPLRLTASIARPAPSGTVAIVGARAITMRGDEVIEDAVIVLDGERIAAIGPAGSVSIPAGARTLDLRGRTVFPGLVDVHAHMGYGHGEVTAETLPAYAANLAFGVTTAHDPSADTPFVFGSRELVEAGRRVGPRILSTGYILYGAESEDKASIASLDDARSHLRRLASYGAFSVKSYNQPRRDQRRWVLAAARELGMLVVPEGGSTLAHNLTMILDGHTGIEHAVPVEQLRADVVGLWGAQPGVHYTPTLLVGYGGIWGENAFYQRYDVWRDPRLQRFTPPGALEAKGKRRDLMAPEEDWQHVRLASTAWRLAQAGVRVNLGAHGQLQGLGPHWELWALTEGGFSPLEALRAATANGAAYLGIDGDVGSLAPGRFADLVVVSGDPLADIHASTSIVGVMKGGVLYDPDTLATTFPEAGPPLPTPWAAGQGLSAGPWEVHGGCGCASGG